MAQRCDRRSLRATSDAWRVAAFFKAHPEYEAEWDDVFDTLSKAVRIALRTPNLGGKPMGGVIVRCCKNITTRIDEWTLRAGARLAYPDCDVSVKDDSVAVWWDA